MRTRQPRFFRLYGFRANAAAGKSEPTLPNLLIFHRIIKRFEEKLKVYRDSILHTHNPCGDGGIDDENRLSKGLKCTEIKGFRGLPPKPAAARNPF